MLAEKRCRKVSSRPPSRTRYCRRTSRSVGDRIAKSPVARWPEGHPAEHIGMAQWIIS
jgi:hypothetical protein